MTLFEKITKNPETLAGFISDLTERCASDDITSCFNCPFVSNIGTCDTPFILKKLQTEVPEKKTRSVTVEIDDSMHVLDVIKAIIEADDKGRT